MKLLVYDIEFNSEFEEISCCGYEKCAMENRFYEIENKFSETIILSTSN